MFLAGRLPWFNTLVHLTVTFLLVVSLLVIPTSPTAKSVFVSMIVALVLFTPTYRHDLLSLLNRPWCVASLMLFFIALFGCIWSPALDYQKLDAIKKYTKLLFLPIFVVGFSDPRARRYGIYAFLVAMFVTCILSILKFQGILDFNGPDQGKVFYNHIITSSMMAFATYLSALLSVRETGKMRVYCSVLVLLFSYQILFINTGRTGYAAYLLLISLFLIQTLPWRKAVLALILVCSLFGLSYYNSAPMQFVVKQGIDNIRDCIHGDKNNPVGFRLQFHEFAKKLFLSHPWFGNGTGSYTYYFRQEDPVPTWQAQGNSELRSRPSIKNLFEPHSQYWLVAAEFGMLGILALCFFFGSLLIASLRLHSMRSIAIALLAPFILGNFSDSLLFYSGSGYFFLFFMALCLGEELQLSK